MQASIPQVSHARALELAALYVVGVGPLTARAAQELIEKVDPWLMDLADQVPLCMGLCVCSAFLQKSADRLVIRLMARLSWCKLGSWSCMQETLLLGACAQRAEYRKRSKCNPPASSVVMLPNGTMSKQPSP
eukprot:1160468-Pelagomonas_calceolata.AAC.12